MKVYFTFYLILIHVFVGVAVVKTDIVARFQAKLGYEVVKDELTSHFYTMLAFHRRIDKNLPAKSVLFIGDSITQGLAVSAVYPQSVNFGIGQDTTFGVVTRLPIYTSIPRSKLVVVAVGVNDLMRRQNDEIIENYRKIISLIPANVPILFSAIFPVDEVASELKGVNARINKINIRLGQLCSDNPRLYFINSSEFFVDANGGLAQDFHIGDGIHLNSIANGIWITKLNAMVKIITAH